jgi:predicted phosphodiesterase
VREAATQGAEALIHCGDLLGTQTLSAAMRVGLPMQIIHGNNLGDQVSLALDIVHSPLAAYRREPVK